MTKRNLLRSSVLVLTAASATPKAPPDYGFDYEGVHPWVWRSSNREVQLIEPVDDGYHYY